MTRITRIGATALCVAVCGGGARSAGTARVVLGAPGSPDTARFTVPVSARLCAGSRGLLIVGAAHGEGVLLWLRDSTGTPAGGTYPLLARGDGAVRGAVVSVRFVIGQLAHGVTVDDGTAFVSRDGARIGVRVRGRGREAMSSLQHTAQLDLSGVPVESDTASCRELS